MPSIRLKAGAVALGALALAGMAAEPAFSASASASGAGHGRAAKSRKKDAQPQIPREGFWKLAAGASQQIFVNQGKAAAQVVVYVCVDPRPQGRPVVRIEMIGRPPIEEPAGCQNVYLDVDAGDWVALVNPAADGVSGSYKIAAQAQQG